MEKMKVSISLMDFLVLKSGCMYISDLRFLSNAVRQMLSYEVMKISADSFSAWEWNDAIEYFSGERVSLEVEAAQAKLFDCLRKKL